MVEKIFLRQYTNYSVSRLLALSEIFLCRGGSAKKNLFWSERNSKTYGWRRFGLACKKNFDSYTKWLEKPKKKFFWFFYVFFKFFEVYQMLAANGFSAIVLRIFSLQNSVKKNFKIFSPWTLGEELRKIFNFAENRFWSLWPPKVDTF